MTDMSIKGQGNSRFLKTSVSDGTTWADVLTMMRAGTFPFDLNGLNAAGINNSGTALTKANLLTDTTATELELTSVDPTINEAIHALFIKMQNHKLITTTSTTITLNANTTTIVNGNPSSLAVTLGTPSSDVDTEYRLLFSAGADFQYAETAPTGYTIIHNGESLVWSADKIYEISYVPLNTTKIGMIVKEWNPTLT